MAIDFSHYNPPGVYIQPEPGPQLAVNSSQPTAVGIFGLSIGYRSFVETVQIPQDKDSDTPNPTRTLSHAGIDVNSISVVGVSSASGTAVAGISYEKGIDYTVALSDEAIAHGYAQGDPGATYVIKRVIDGGSISELELVQVHYQYTDKDFFEPHVFYDYDDIKTAYGLPWNMDTKTIQSELSLAAEFAFLNGAYSAVCVAVQPTGQSGNATDGDYIEALSKLEDEGLVGIVVPATGSRPNLYGANGPISQHVDTQSATMFERRALVGLDGTVVPVPTSTRKQYAEAVDDKRVMMTSPDEITYYATEVNDTVTVGGQYMAAALAGMTMALSWAQPLTHKQLTGFKMIPNKMIAGIKNAETQAGLCVVEQTRTRQIQVRHGVSTDFTSLITREWSITGQQDAMSYRLRDYLDAANLIGQPIYPYTLANVKGSADAALQSLLRDALIVDYSGLKVRQLLTNPDVLQISFSWLPAFPLNYLVVTFAISLTTGTVNSIGSTANRDNDTSVTNPVTSHTITPPPTPHVSEFGGQSNTLRST